MASRRVDGGLYYDAESREMKKRDREMIPRGAIVAMVGVALTALTLTTFASVTDRPTVGRPAPADTLETRTFVIEGDGVAVSAVELDGRVLIDTDNGAFVAVVNDALVRKRKVHGVEGNPPVTLARLANGRLVLSDPATDWQAELTSFGAGNAAQWRALFDN